MRASQFIVTSDHAFDDGRGSPSRVVLHSSSGEVYVLAEDVLRTLREKPHELPHATMVELAEAGLAVDDGADEFGDAVRANARVANSVRTRTFVLMPSSYCNMGCGYCGQKHFKSAQTAEHRAAVKSRVLRAAEADGASGVHISWFGGEPLMGYAQIIDICSAVLPPILDRGLCYSSKMVTNGALLTLEKARRLHLECRVDNFEITLDGPAHRHDVLRPLRSGSPSFERIVDVIRRACDDDELSGLSFTIRTNVSNENKADHERFAAAMAAAGLARPAVSFYTAMVRPWGNDVSEVAVPQSEVVDVEMRWLRAYRDHGLNTALLPIARRNLVCVAVARGAEVIDPRGNVHSCTEQPLVPGREGTAVGHVADLQTPAVRPRGAFDDWHDELQGDTTAHCPTCAIFPICGGSCPLVWREGGVACPSLKRTMPARLTLYGDQLGLSR